MDRATYYARLEQGARHLASQAASDAEATMHLEWANRYYRLRVDAEAIPEPEPVPLAAA